MQINREAVLDTLGKIMEPDLQNDLVSLNLIAALEISATTISLVVHISNPALHARKRMQEAIVFNLKRVFGQELQVNCQIQGLDAQSRTAHRKILPDVKYIIAVASGKGGVGKSTITANLAGGLSKKGYRVGIVDADIHGPSMPTMFDLVGERPKMTDVNGKSLIAPIESNGIKILSIGFFTNQDDAVVWRGPMASKALTQLFTDAHWGELDYLLVDLPPGTSDIHLSLMQTVPLDGVVIVSTPQEVALADARRGIQMFRLDSFNVPIIGIVENMAYFTPAELPNNKYYIFGRDGARNLAQGMQVPFLGSIPLVQGVCEAGDSGTPAVFQQNNPTTQAFDELVHNFENELNAMVASRKHQA